jgi:hypothetical protein
MSPRKFNIFNIIKLARRWESHFWRRSRKLSGPTVHFSGAARCRTRRSVKAQSPAGGSGALLAEGEIAWCLTDTAEEGTRDGAERLQGRIAVTGIAVIRTAVVPNRVDQRARRGEAATGLVVQAADPLI